MSEIMCTLTASQILEQESLVKDMYDAGMRSVRINTAHLSGVGHLQALAAKLKSLAPQIKILIDTKGPEMRTTAIADDARIFMRHDDEVLIEGTADDQPTSDGHIHVNFAYIHRYVDIGDTLLIDDGHISLLVTGVDSTLIRAKVVDGGILGSRKGMAVRGKDLPLPAVSAQDHMYIEWSSGSDLIDVIAHSFVRSASDVSAVKRAMRGYGKPIVAKIENQQGIDNIDGILREADGILIARGDLTASIGTDLIPQAQAYIAAAAKAVGKPLYLATNILPSMMGSVEASDTDINGIRLAKSQGVDVMLLTNETAAGQYPLQAVKALRCALG